MGGVAAGLAGLHATSIATIFCLFLEWCAVTSTRDDLPSSLWGGRCLLRARRAARVGPGGRTSSTTPVRDEVANSRGGWLLDSFLRLTATTW